MFLSCSRCKTCLTCSSCEKVSSDAIKISSDKSGQNTNLITNCSLLVEKCQVHLIVQMAYA
ncbi:hypothetical protein A0H76_1222 [Hepatospora eriocheir]|uniref:Uncharacterized protein n=1 Tax=Hepatospora eriocheir TaxID=1081669 RepID=A0A1X0QHE8_9MICR|nr:hypothetical protein A0H76_1222 [Hepatospora eriocheir]